MGDEDTFCHAYPIPGFKMYYLRAAVGHSPLQNNINTVSTTPFVFWESRQLPFPNQQQPLSRRVQRWKDCLGLDHTWDHHFIRSFHSTLMVNKKRKSEQADGDIQQKHNLPEQSISTPILLALLGEAHRHKMLVPLLLSALGHCLCCRVAWVCLLSSFANVVYVVKQLVYDLLYKPFFYVSFHLMLLWFIYINIFQHQYVGSRFNQSKDSKTNNR